MKETTERFKKINCNNDNYGRVENKGKPLLE